MRDIQKLDFMVKLSELLDTVNDWLKFAEAKNGVLVASSGLAIWAIVRIVASETLGCWVIAYLSQLALFLTVALVLALISFLPVTRYSIIVPTTRGVAKPNLVYFGYLATLHPASLIQEYMTATGIQESDLKPIDNMYAEQIIANSRIAVAKFSMFKVGVYCAIFGVLTPFFGGVLIFIVSRWKQVDGF